MLNPAVDEWHTSRVPSVVRMGAGLSSRRVPVTRGAGDRPQLQLATLQAALGTGTSDAE